MEKIKKIIEKGQLFFILFCIVLCVWGYVVTTAPPAYFPVGTIVTIAPGMSLEEIGSELKNDHIISSVTLFRSSVIILGGERKVIAGDYLMNMPENVFVMAYRMVRGDFHLEPVKITIPEGWTVSQISEYLGTHISHFDSAEFFSEAKNQEGYLFPDTYFFSPVITPETVIQTMHTNFETSVATVSDLNSFEASTSQSFDNIITMASIIEAEARTTADRQIIAGILWKRLSIGMPLQVDSTLSYITGKNTYELTDADLKIDSPYNTYLHAGLPPTPIDNPGLDSIRATIDPISSNYLYFFSSPDGTMYYATTLVQQEKNIRLYGNKNKS